MSNSALIVLCTVPDQQTGRTMAREIVANKLAACCNIVPRIKSVYYWEGAVHEDDETLLIIKTNRSSYAGLEKWILDKHPYETPEIIACKIDEGSKNYLEWITETIGSK